MSHGVLFIIRDESHICVVFIMDDLDLGGAIHAGPDLCGQRIPCPNIGGWLTPRPEYWWPADPQPRIWVVIADPGPDIGGHR